jgi:hypothetical protein
MVLRSRSVSAHVGKGLAGGASSAQFSLSLSLSLYFTFASECDEEMELGFKGVRSAEGFCSTEIHAELSD